MYLSNLFHQFYFLSLPPTCLLQALRLFTFISLPCPTHHYFVWSHMFVSQGIWVEFSGIVHPMDVMIPCHISENCVYFRNKLNLTPKEKNKLNVNMQKKLTLTF